MVTKKQAVPAKRGKAQTRAPKLARLPNLLDRKIYKTGQTRGADDDVIYQNRVSRSSTALIPFAWIKSRPNLKSEDFQSGAIVLISPQDYIALGASENARQIALARCNLTLGRDALVFYQKRVDWDKYPPAEFGWKVAIARTGDLGGHYVARIASTTSEKKQRVNEGFTSGTSKGAGIRAYEYASAEVIAQARIQLEALYWLSKNSAEAAADNGMDILAAERRKAAILDLAASEGLLDKERLQRGRTLNAAGVCVCPLCLKEIDARDFFSKLTQAEGREVHDLTVTTVNLFHVKELRLGSYNHKPYNLGWGCHHCNVVVKDVGIDETLEWMKTVIARNS